MLPEFSPADQEAIRNYAYRGGDSSLLYKYILSPFAQYLVDKVMIDCKSANSISYLLTSSGRLNF